MADGSVECSYVATAEEFEEWGGDPDDWSDRLEEMGIEGETWEYWCSVKHWIAS